MRIPTPSRLLVSGILLLFLGCGAKSSPPPTDFGLAACPKGTCVVATLGDEILDRLEGRIAKPDEWSRVLPVFTAREADRSGGRPILGSYRRTGRHQLEFAPRLPLLPGRRYTVRIRWNGVAAVTEDPRLVKPPAEWAFRVPGEPLSGASAVASVEPGGEEIPANLLRIHLEFDRPMRSDGVDRYVRLVDGSGNEIVEPFVGVSGGLWDPTGRRLTLLLDPGDPRGPAPRSRSGPVLRSGREVELVVEASWPDRSGEPLGSMVRKGWRVTGPDRDPPDPGTWSLGIPAVETSDPLRIDFRDVLDGPLLRTSLEVRRGGEAVSGRWEVRGGGRAVAFSPAGTWVPDRYRLLVADTLEDLAGNAIRGPRSIEFRPRVPKGAASEDGARKATVPGLGIGS